MKVKTLLKQAQACSTNEQAAALLNRFITSIQATKAFKGRFQSNEEAYMEGDKPNVRFELHHQLSTRYTIQVTPEIRDGELTMTVVTVRMNDNAGQSSKDRELDQDTEATFTADEADDLQVVANQALSELVHQHANLMEEVGLPYAIAREAAEKAWAKSK